MLLLLLQLQFQQLLLLFRQLHHTLIEMVDTTKL